MTIVTPAQLAIAAQQLDGTEFATRFKGLYLLRRAQQAADDEAMPFRTVVGGLCGLDEPIAAGATAAQVATLAKRAGNPYPFRISVGRAANCDVVLRFAFVSKLHAIIRIVDSTFELLDRGSANGTSVNGKRLAPDVRAPLRSGDTVGFGQLQCEVMDARGLHRFLTGVDG